MHVVIAGCGRVGALLAQELTGAGHDVAVIDKDPRAFRRLGDGFAGTTVTGVVFDPTALEKAGIRRAQAFVAVTSGDNSNVVSARTAKEAYGVERVVARIYDPQRARIFERLGITTVATAQWTADEILRALLPASERIVGTLGTGHGDVVLLSLTVPEGARDVPVETLNRSGEMVLAAITREGSTTVPVSGALLVAGDEVHLAVQRSAVEAARTLVAGMGEEQR